MTPDQIESISKQIRHDHLESQHPRLVGLPDYGLVLEPEVEQRIRGRAEANGVDFDQMKREFELAHQVVDAEKEHAKCLGQLDNRVVPLNAVKYYFEGMIEMAISTERARRVVTK